MDCWAFKEQLQAAFPDYHFQLRHVGNGWARIFIQYHGVQLGRLSLNPAADGHEVYSMKSYKRGDMFFDLEDRFFYLFYYWHSYGVVPQIDFLSLMRQAKQIRNAKITELEAWREQNPKFKVVRDDEGNERTVKKSRPRLSKNWMSVFHKLVFEALERAKEQFTPEQVKVEARACARAAQNIRTALTEEE